MTFPGGTHDLWLRYWLASLRRRRIDAKDRPGAATADGAEHDRRQRQGILRRRAVERRGRRPRHRLHHARHPRSVAQPSRKGVGRQRGVRHCEVRRSRRRDGWRSSKASEWLDDPGKPVHRCRHPRHGDSTSTPNRTTFVAASPASTTSAPGSAPRTSLANQMQFFRDGQTNAPRRSYGYWALAQYLRLGLLTEAPDYKALVDTIVLSDLYSSVATKAEHRRARRRHGPIRGCASTTPPSTQRPPMPKRPAAR